jgi:hypothetical protein
MSVIGLSCPTLPRDGKFLGNKRITRLNEMDAQIPESCLPGKPSLVGRYEVKVYLPSHDKFP